MCFQMTQRVELVKDYDVRTLFRVHDAGRKPDEKELRDYVKTAAGIYIANSVIGKVIEVAESFGNTALVKDPRDIPTMFDNGVLFVDKSLNSCLVDVAHPETTWATPDCRIRDRAIMIQLKDFSFVAQTSIHEPKPEDWPEYPVDERELIRRECRVKFNLDVPHAWIYQMYGDWRQAELNKIRASL